MMRKNPPCCWLNVVEQKIEALQAKLEALVAEREIKDAMVRSECAGMYVEMCDGKKRTSWLEEYSRMLDRDMQSLATRLDAIGVAQAPVRAGEPEHRTGGAFGHLSTPEQHRMQQRGSEY